MSTTASSSVNSFTIYTPTRIFFGADQLAGFAEASAKLGRKALIVTGGGTVEKLGFLAQVTTAFHAAGVSLVHFRGIEPNPESSTIDRATEIARQEKVEFVVALGGGSAMDAAKAIAALAVTDAPDIWPFVIGEPKAFQLTKALPIVAIPTTAATASEVTPFAVISNRSRQGKSVLIGEFIKPLVAWLNPVFTAGLSRTTTQDGAADILSHVFENYILGGNDSFLADRYSESVMATVLEMLPRLEANPQDLAARGNLMWASTLALNDYQTAGRRSSPFILHSLEHALSGFSPNLAHGRGLAALYPSYFRWLIANGRAQERFALLGSRLFGLTGTEAQQAIGFVERFEAWLKANHLYQSLADLGFTESQYPAIAEYSLKTYGDGKQFEALGPVTAAQIVEIFRGTVRQARQSKAA